MTTDGPIVFISLSRIRPGQLDGLRSFLAVGVPALEAAKPRTLAFLAYVDEASMTLTIVWRSTAPPTSKSAARALRSAVDDPDYQDDPERQEDESRQRERPSRVPSSQQA